MELNIVNCVLASIAILFIFGISSSLSGKFFAYAKLIIYIAGILIFGLTAFVFFSSGDWSRNAIQPEDPSVYAHSRGKGGLIITVINFFILIGPIGCGSVFLALSLAFSLLLFSDWQKIKASDFRSIDEIKEDEKLKNYSLKELAEIWQIEETTVENLFQKLGDPYKISVKENKEGFIKTVELKQGFVKQIKERDLVNK